MRIKMSKQPPPAPTASAVGPCPTVIQIVGRPGTGSLPSTIAPPTIGLQSLSTNRNDLPLKSWRTNQWIVMKLIHQMTRSIMLKIVPQPIYTPVRKSHIMVCPSVMSIRPSIRKTFLFRNNSSYFVYC